MEFLAPWLIVSYELSPAIAGENLSMNETEKYEEEYSVMLQKTLWILH